MAQAVQWVPDVEHSAQGEVHGVHCEEVGSKNLPETHVAEHVLDSGSSRRLELQAVQLVADGPLHDAQVASHPEHEPELLKKPRPQSVTQDLVVS